jgi:hypothetical protein
MVQKVGGFVVSLIAALAGLTLAMNYLVRAGSGDGDSKAMVEHSVGRSATSSVASMIHAESVGRVDQADTLSARVADLIAEHGANLASDPRLSPDRIRAAGFARTAFETASGIPDNHLGRSNPDLPRQYKGQFVESMRLFAEGLEHSDPARVREGMAHYDRFLEWIQSRDRGESKNSR